MVLKLARLYICAELEVILKVSPFFHWKKIYLRTKVLTIIEISVSYQITL